MPPWLLPALGFLALVIVLNLIGLLIGARHPRSDTRSDAGGWDDTNTSASNHDY